MRKKVLMEKLMKSREWFNSLRWFRISQ
jgi:hypothetical protein